MGIPPRSPRQRTEHPRLSTPRPGQQQRQKAADASQAYVQQDEQGPFVRAKHGVENNEDDEDRQRNDQGQPRFRAFFALVFARPSQAVARRQFRFLADLFDCVLDRRSQIAASHVESDGHLPRVALAENVVRAIFDFYAG